MIPTIHMLCGQSGAGKTTFANQLENTDSPTLLFSIDSWMNRLFAPDIVTLDPDWINERVIRVQEQVLEVARQILRNDMSVLLDLGFHNRTQRKQVYDWAAPQNANLVLHYLDVPAEIRKQRIAKRNEEQDPAVYSFEVTELMFNFMEGRFDPPTNNEVPGEFRHQRFGQAIGTELP